MGQYANFYGSNNGDRVYSPESFEEWLRPFYKNGVFNGELQVTANGNMTVTVAAGNAYINGRMKCFDSAVTLTLATAHATLNRIDNVIVRRNDSDRDFEIMIQQGTYSSVPIAPEPVRSGSYYDLVLAQIYVSAASSTIIQANVTDTRMDSDLCGWVASNIEEIDFDQIKAQFDSWFETVQDQLPGDYILPGTPFTVTSGTTATSNTAQSWDSDGEYLWHIDVPIGGMSADRAVYNPVFNTAALDILAPYLETLSGYIRLYVNEATTSVEIVCSSYEVRV